MAHVLSSTNFRFLFRSDQGQIDSGTWWVGTAALTLVLGILSVVWLALSPYAHRSGEIVTLFDGMVVLAYGYLVVFAFLVLLLGVCQYNLSAKRFQALGRPGALALALPLSLIFAGAALWLQPRMVPDFPLWLAWMFVGLAFGIIIWNIAELGFSHKKIV